MDPSQYGELVERTERLVRRGKGSPALLGLAKLVAAAAPREIAPPRVEVREVRVEVEKPVEVVRAVRDEVGLRAKHAALVEAHAEIERLRGQLAASDKIREGAVLTATEATAKLDAAARAENVANAKCSALTSKLADVRREVDAVEWAGANSRTNAARACPGCGGADPHKYDKRHPEVGHRKGCVVAGFADRVRRLLG